MEIERTIFGASFESVWRDTEALWSERGPAELERAAVDRQAVVGGDATAVNPDERYPTALQFKNDVEAYMARRGISVTADAVGRMKPGSVIVDMAVEQGGNCPLSELGKTVVKHGVHIIGEANLPALCAADASALYARNVIDFMKLIIDKDGNIFVVEWVATGRVTLQCDDGGRVTVEEQISGSLTVPVTTPG